MRWDKAFSPGILRLGSETYANGAVNQLNARQSGGFTLVSAQVSEIWTYSVQVRLKGDELIHTSCNCLAGRGNVLCRHAAAVCIAYAQNKPERKPIRVYPFHHAADGVYRYFDLEAATKDLTIYDVDVEAAEEYAKQYDPEFDLATGYIENEHGDDVPVLKLKNTRNYSEIVLTQDSIYRADCTAADCPEAFRVYTPKQIKHPCKHILMMLLAADTFIRESNPGDATNSAAAKLMKVAGRSGIAQHDFTQERVPEVSLQPRLFGDDASFQLGFRIGRGKMYVVKDVGALIRSEEARGIYKLGKNNEIDFSRHTFDAGSMPYYDMLKQEMHDLEGFNRRISERGVGYGPALSTVFAEIGVNGPRADQLYSMLAGVSSKAEYQDRLRTGNKAVPLHRGYEDPKLSFMLKRVVGRTGQFDGIRLTGSVPPVIRGTEGVYCVTLVDGVALLSRVSTEAQQALTLLEKAGLIGDVDLTVGRRNMTRFYRTILPLLRKCAEIQEPDADEVESYLPPEPVFRFYMDMEDSTPACRPEVWYGETMVLPFKSGTPRDAMTRDDAREDTVGAMLMKYFTYVDDRTGELKLPEADEDALFKLMDSGVEEMQAAGEVYMTDAFRKMEVHAKPQVKVGVSLKSDILDLTIATEDIPFSELPAVLSSYRMKKKYHRLKDGSFVKMNEGIGTLAVIADTLQAKDKQIEEGSLSVPAYRALYVDSALENAEDIAAERNNHFKQLVRNFKTVDESDYEVPASLKNVLRPYQVHGYRWMRTLADCGFGGILADDMGLGKTLQTIAVLLADRQEGGKHPALVVCPASLVYNWQEELNRFAPELRTMVAAGSKSTRGSLLAGLKDIDVIITSYDLLKRDVEEYKGIHFGYQFIDEAQYIKTHTTAAAKSVKEIQAEHRFALTGTPIENRLSELWSIFDYIMPGFLYGYEKFRRELETPIVKQEDGKASERLKKMVSPFILRRLKTDVLKDLPEKLEEVRYARFDTEQQHVYDSQAARMKLMLTSGDTQHDKMKILRELTRIRQICCDPSLLLEDYAGASAKREACLDLIESAIEGGHRILLFSQFTSMLALLEEDLAAIGVTMMKITGDTPKQERLRLVNRFNAGEGQVFLISLKAGGNGLNLTGADTVIHYDPWWNAAAQNQATDRAHRFGQTKSVTVYKLIAKDTIEEKILKLQQDKAALADEILTGEGTSLGSMSAEELLALIG